MCAAVASDLENSASVRHACASLNRTEKFILGCISEKKQFGLFRCQEVTDQVSMWCRMIMCALKREISTVEVEECV